MQEAEETVPDEATKRRHNGLPPIASIFDSLDVSVQNPKRSQIDTAALPSSLVTPALLAASITPLKSQVLRDQVNYKTVNILGARKGSFIRGVGALEMGCVYQNPDGDRPLGDATVAFADERKTNVKGRPGFSEYPNTTNHLKPFFWPAYSSVFPNDQKPTRNCFVNEGVQLQVLGHDLLPNRMERLLAMIAHNRIPGIIRENEEYASNVVASEGGPMGPRYRILQRYYIPTCQDMLVALWGPPITSAKDFKYGRGAAWSKPDLDSSNEKFNSCTVAHEITPEERTIMNQNIIRFRDMVALKAEPDVEAKPGNATINSSGPFGPMSGEEQAEYVRDGLAKLLLAPNLESDPASPGHYTKFAPGLDSMSFPGRSNAVQEDVDYVRKDVLRAVPASLPANVPFSSVLSDQYTKAGLEFDEAVFSKPYGAWMADSIEFNEFKHVDLQRFDRLRDTWRLAQLDRLRIGSGMGGNETTFDLSLSDLREVAALSHAYDKFLTSAVEKEIKSRTSAERQKLTVEKKKKTFLGDFDTELNVRVKNMMDDLKAKNTHEKKAHELQDNNHLGKKIQTLVTYMHIGTAVKALTGWGQLHFTGNEYQSAGKGGDGLSLPTSAMTQSDLDEIARLAGMTGVVPMAYGPHGVTAEWVGASWVPKLPVGETLQFKVIATNQAWEVYASIPEALQRYNSTSHGLPIDAHKLSDLMANGQKHVFGQSALSYLGFGSHFKTDAPGKFATRPFQWIPVHSRPMDVAAGASAAVPMTTFGSEEAVDLNANPQIGPVSDAGMATEVAVPKGKLYFTRTVVVAGKGTDAFVFHHFENEKDLEDLRKSMTTDGVPTVYATKYVIGKLDPPITSDVRNNTGLAAGDVGLTMMGGERAVRRPDGSVVSDTSSKMRILFPTPAPGRLDDKDPVRGRNVLQAAKELMGKAIEEICSPSNEYGGKPLHACIFTGYETNEEYQKSPIMFLKTQSRKILAMLHTQAKEHEELMNRGKQLDPTSGGQEWYLPDSRVKIGPGFLKSLMQKTVRLGARTWEFWGDDYRPAHIPTKTEADGGARLSIMPDVLPIRQEGIDARLVAMAAFVLCCSERGDMQMPELQMKFVPGPSAAFKRLGVIMVEDGWPVALPKQWLEKGYDASYWLSTFMAHALILSYPERVYAGDMPYHASDSMIVSAMVVIASATASPYHVAHELFGSKLAHDHPTAATRLIHRNMELAGSAPKHSLEYQVNRVPMEYLAMITRWRPRTSVKDDRAQDWSGASMYALMQGDNFHSNEGEVPVGNPQQILEYYHLEQWQKIHSYAPHTSLVADARLGEDGLNLKTSKNPATGRAQIEGGRFEFLVEVGTGHMHTAAAMLRVIRSFGGDMDMMDRAASFGHAKDYPSGLLTDKMSYYFSNDPDHPTKKTTYHGTGLFEQNRPTFLANGLAWLEKAKLAWDDDGKYKPENATGDPILPKWVSMGGERARIRCAFAPVGFQYLNPDAQRVYTVGDVSMSGGGIEIKGMTLRNGGEQVGLGIVQQEWTNDLGSSYKRKSFPVAHPSRSIDGKKPPALTINEGDAEEGYGLPVYEKTGKQPPVAFQWQRTENVPMMHIMDQHVYAGIGHLWPAWPTWMDAEGSAVMDVTPDADDDSSGEESDETPSALTVKTKPMLQDTFLRRFRFIFDNVTGWNPRNRFYTLPQSTHAHMDGLAKLTNDQVADLFRGSNPSHELRVLYVRSAQAAILATLRRRPAISQPLGKFTAQDRTLFFPIEPGILAGGVGTVGDVKLSDPKDVNGKHTLLDHFRVGVKVADAPGEDGKDSFLVVSDAEFAKLGLDKEEKRHVYKLIVSIGMTSPDPVVLDYVSNAERGARPKLIFILDAVREHVIDLFYSNNKKMNGYRFASALMPEFKMAYFMDLESSKANHYSSPAGWYITCKQFSHYDAFVKEVGRLDEHRVCSWTKFAHTDGDDRLAQGVIHQWNYDRHKSRMVFSQINPIVNSPPKFPLSYTFGNHNDQLLVEFLRRDRSIHSYAGRPTMVIGYKDRIGEICMDLVKAANHNNLVGRVVLERMKGFLSRAVTEIALPKPSVTGHRSSDDLEAIPGDWLIWRGLMYISMYATGAFVCKQIPEFEIKNTLLTREVVYIVMDVLDKLEDGQVDESKISERVQWRRINVDMINRFGKPVGDEDDAPSNPSPTEVQYLAVGGLLQRDNVPMTGPEWPRPVVPPRPLLSGNARELPLPRRGHFLAMDTGMGKTFAGVFYALSWLEHTAGAKRILWICPKDIIRNTVSELSKWGLQDRIHEIMPPKTGTGSSSKARPSTASASVKSVMKNTSFLRVFDHYINIIGHEDFQTGSRREELEQLLFSKASTSFCIFDEVHKLYRFSRRSTTARVIADACPKFVCMSATPLEGVQAPIAFEWLDDTVPFSINRKPEDKIQNKMVAAANCIKLAQPLTTTFKDQIVKLVDLPDIQLNLENELGYEVPYNAQAVNSHLNTLFQTEQIGHWEIFDGVMLEKAKDNEKAIRVVMNMLRHQELLKAGTGSTSGVETEPTAVEKRMREMKAHNHTPPPIPRVFFATSELSISKGAGVEWQGAAAQARRFASFKLADQAVKLALYDRARTSAMVLEIKKVLTILKSSSSPATTASYQKQLDNLLLFQEQPTGGCFVVAYNLEEAKMIRRFCELFIDFYKRQKDVEVLQGIGPASLLAMFDELKGGPETAMSKEIESFTLKDSTFVDVVNNTDVLAHIFGMKALIRDSKNSQKPTGPGTGTEDYHSDAGIVITTKTKVAGYDMHHLGCWVTGVYEGNAADRHQARGRIKRIGQERTALYYQTVCPMGTILELLLQKHRSIDCKNASLDQAGNELLRRLKETVQAEPSAKKAKP